MKDKDGVMQEKKPNFIVFKVHMLAFCKKGTIREVEVPNDEFMAAEEVDDILEMVFIYGQNELQFKEYPSVSVGDVIEYGDDYYEVAMAGFRELPDLDLIDGERSKRGDITY